MHIRGSCHCGNISYRLEWRPDPAQIPARACRCSFCVKHGGVWTSCPDGELVIAIKDGAHARTYRFGTGTADFHVCALCGVVPVVTSQIDGKTHAVVNVNTFDNVDAAMLTHSEVNLDAEDTRSRLQRRVKNWIGSVRFVQGAA